MSELKLCFAHGVQSLRYLFMFCHFYFTLLDFLVVALVSTKRSDQPIILNCFCQKTPAYKALTAMSLDLHVGL